MGGLDFRRVGSTLVKSGNERVMLFSNHVNAPVHITLIGVKFI